MSKVRLPKHQYNPGLWLISKEGKEVGAHFGFDMGWEDYDEVYHRLPVGHSLRPPDDPCQLPDDVKVGWNRERDEMVQAYYDWCAARGGGYEDEDKDDG